MGDAELSGGSEVQKGGQETGGLARSQAFVECS
jgi:hypothetical protein